MTNSKYRIQCEIDKGYPQCLCCGPGHCKIQYNTILNLNITTRTTAIAFSKNLLFTIRGELVGEDENFANIKMSNIITWSKRKKFGLQRRQIQNHANFKEEMKKQKKKIISTKNLLYNLQQ